MLFFILFALRLPRMRWAFGYAALRRWWAQCLRYVWAQRCCPSLRSIRRERMEYERRKGSIGYGRYPYNRGRSEEHTSELQSRQYLVCRLLLEKKKQKHPS